MSNIEDTKPIDVLADRVWSGTHWHYPNIEKMIERIHTLTRDLAAAREEIKGLSNEVEDAERRHGKACEELAAAKSELSRHQSLLTRATEAADAANATVAQCKAANTLVWNDDADLGCPVARWSGWRFTVYESANGWRWNQTGPGLGMDGGHESTIEQAKASAQQAVDRMVQANITAAEAAREKGGA